MEENKTTTPTTTTTEKEKEEDSTPSSSSFSPFPGALPPHSPYPLGGVASDSSPRWGRRGEVTIGIEDEHQETQQNNYTATSSFVSVGELSREEVEEWGEGEEEGIKEREKEGPFSPIREKLSSSGKAMGEGLVNYFQKREEKKKEKKKKKKEYPFRFDDIEVDEDQFYCRNRCLGFIPLDLITEQYRSRALITSSFFVWFATVMMSPVLGTGYPCTFTHTIDLDYISQFDNCWNKNVTTPDDYNVPEMSFHDVRYAIISANSIKFIFSIVGNSNYHSPIWLLGGLAFLIWFLIDMTYMIHYCGEFCYDQNGDQLSSGQFDTDVSYQAPFECSYSTCKSVIQSGAVINDTTLSFGIYIMLYFDAIFHVHCFFVQTMNKAGVARHFSPNDYLPENLRNFHYPARLYMSFFANIFLGTLACLGSTTYFLNVSRNMEDLAESLSDTDDTEITEDLKSIIHALDDFSGALRLSTLITVPISWVIFAASSCFSMFAFLRESQEKRAGPDLNVLEISYAPQYVGVFISNCLFGLSYTWTFLGLFVFCCSSEIIRDQLVWEHRWFLLSLCATPFITMMIRIIFLETLFATREKGITHPKSYRFMDTVQLLFSSASGPFYGFYRLFYALLVLLVMIQRVDWAIVPEPFKDWDYVNLYYRQVLNIDKLNHQFETYGIDRDKDRWEESRTKKQEKGQESDPLLMKSANSRLDTSYIQ